MSDMSRLTTALEERYRIERPLGAGGMATVYLATDLKHDREVALKVLRPELGAVLGVERFLAEIKITARLDHPHILTLIDSGAEGGFLYYVLPLVRGESLRDKLNREHQLGLDEALAITRQIASALDYAHRHGVVHRDIKPENILLLEGEAMLADFGIALAVSEAGGNRLTETGLSLGTPQYMSPEQATGDRQLDARSDVYSLAAVLYEMLAGEPPVTGPTAQAMIAKLMTERPVHLRVVRGSVPDAVDAAVARALDKTPADRFPSAGEFAQALVAKAATPAAATVVTAAPRSRRGWMIGVASVVLVVMALSAWLLAGRKPAHQAQAYVLRDRTQLTSSGNVFASAVSPDGKQLAYITHNCAPAGCRYAVDLQDVGGGSATHRVLDGATAAYGLEWSPDRRNLIFVGTLRGRWGFYLVSALGGPPRYLSSGAAMFWAGGDSLLVGPPLSGGDSVFQVKVTSIDGAIADSIRIPGPGGGVAALSVSPGGRWIVALVLQSGRGLWQVLDRQGKVADRVINSCTCPGRITRDALWLTRSGVGAESIVRIGIDSATGRLATEQDTLLSGNFNNFSVTADGSSLVIDDGTRDYSLWAVRLPDALRGRYDETQRLVRTSTELYAQLSPDGARMLLGRNVPSSTGGTERRLSVLPFTGGSEAPLNIPGTPRASAWSDSVTLSVTSQTPAGLRVRLLDVRTGAVLRSLDLPDSLALSPVPLPDGWAWIPSSRDRVVVQRGGRTTEIPKLPWYGEILRLSADASGERLAMAGWNAGSYDSVGIAIVPATGGTPVLWARSPAEEASAGFLGDGALLFTVWDTPESAVLFRVAGPGQMKRLGAITRPIAGVTVSRDLQRAVVLETNRQGDAYVSKVGRR
jgi:Tol biopolymer transport system component